MSRIDRHVAIVGGAGFLGLSLAEHLLARVPHVQLSLFDTKSPNEWLERHPAVRFEWLDVTNKDAVLGKFDGVEVVFHKAGILGGPRSARLETALEYMRINAVGTYNILEAAKWGGVQKVIFDSTEQVFGLCDELRGRHEREPAWPLNYYGVSKIFAEDICRLFANGGMTVIVCRYPRVRSSTSCDIICSFISKILTGEPIVLKNQGGKVLDFVDVADVCQASELLLSRDVPSGVLHIGSGECISLLDLVHLVGDVMGRRATIRFEPDRGVPFDADHYLLDITTARGALNYQPRVSVRDMIERSFQWAVRQGGCERQQVADS